MRTNLPDAGEKLIDSIAGDAAYNVFKLNVIEVPQADV